MKQNTKSLIGLFFSGLIVIALAAGAVVGANAMMKGWEASLANTPNNVIQAVVAAAIFITLGLTLDGFKFKTRLSNIL